MTSRQPNHKIPETNIKKRIAIITLKSPAHLYHCVPIACELAKNQKFKVDIYTDTEQTVALIKALTEDYNVSCRIQILHPALGNRLLNTLTRHPARAKHIISHNQDKFRHYDCIISPDFYTAPLITTSEKNRPVHVFTFHGAGDRAYGFKQQLCLYDLILVSGPMIKQRLGEEGILDCTHSVETGYPKFDLLHHTAPKKLFSNHRKTVIYAPHFQRKETSWYDWGLEVLEYFYSSRKFNLIFAPHVLLMTKWRRRKSIPKRYYTSPHLHLDFGSSNSIDMTYTQQADIYLGDVSSQVYEFLYHPRPCIFLNTKKVNWRHNPDFTHWQLGDVIEDISHLDNAINTANERHSSRYFMRQKAFFADKFSQSTTPSATRAANHIIHYLETR